MKIELTKEDGDHLYTILDNLCNNLEDQIYTSDSNYYGLTPEQVSQKECDFLLIERILQQLK